MHYPVLNLTLDHSQTRTRQLLKVLLPIQLDLVKGRPDSEVIGVFPIIQHTLRIQLIEIGRTKPVAPFKTPRGLICRTQIIQNLSNRYMCHGFRLMFGVMRTHFT